MTMPKAIFLLTLSALLSLAAQVFAQSSVKEGRAGKGAILLVAFGTSVPQAQRAFDKIDLQARRAFPDFELRWAYTSKFIRAKLAQEGTRLSSPEMALAQLMDEGFTRVAVLSLHVFPGKEFHDLNHNAMLFGQMADGFERLVVAPPLLNSFDDMDRTARVLLAHIPSQRKQEEAVIFMGHGNEKHPADAMYAAMNFVFQDLGPNIFVATVQGKPDLKFILPKLVEAKVQKAYLIPFMTVAGEHARKDMAGDSPESWKSVLSQKGITSENIMTGIAEYPEIVDIWLDHLREALSRLE
jgi:sirohydrochlorin cobaltochelatase